VYQFIFVAKKTDGMLFPSVLYSVFVEIYRIPPSWSVNSCPCGSEAFALSFGTSLKTGSPAKTDISIFAPAGFQL
jgi:hypothetical protein